MTVRVRGQDAFHALLADLPAKLEQNVLRGGLRAGVNVIAVEAKAQCVDPEVAATVGVNSRAEPGLVTAKVRLRGKGAFKGGWLEWGTAAHLITVGDEAREGKTVRRLNIEMKRGSLVIGGKFVGSSVMHPGARPYPFLRPALDLKLSEALTAMGNYIQTRLTKFGLDAPDTTFQADEE